MSVAIHGVLGNPPITDATVTPSDVASGKVFYNNDGKQIGSGTILTYKTYECTLTPSM